MLRPNLQLLDGFKAGWLTSKLAACCRGHHRSNLATSKDAIKSATPSKDGSKKSFWLHWTDAFKAVQVRAIKADGFKAARERAREAYTNALESLLAALS